MISYYNKVVQDDLALIIQSELGWNQFHNKTVLITGATGMLAEYIVFVFFYLREHYNIKVTILALCRNRQRAESVFLPFLEKEYFSLICQDVCEPISYSGDIEFIFHLAGNASPYFINHDPVGIMKTNLIGTINLLELAKKKKAKVFFASTREVYGKNEDMMSLDEDAFGSINPMENRSCYPESKRAAESLLRSYFIEYGVEVYIARIAHTYGPGIKVENDGRIMSDLIGNVVRGENIILKSSGDALRSFCYITDAITGIFNIILKGEAGEVYNLSNETEEISIKDLAALLASLSMGKSNVVFLINSDNSGYCNYKRVGLSTEKLENLGWMPLVTLHKGLSKTLKSMSL